MLPEYPILKIAKKLGARLSSSALDELKYFADEYARTLARNALDASKFAQRNTVMKKDVEFAHRRMIR